MAGSRKVERPARLPDAPALALIPDGVQSTLCLTCGEGTHAFVAGAIVNSGLEWERCTACGARALNNAQIDDAWNVINNGAGQALIGACMGSRKTGTAVAIMNQLQGVWLLIVPLHTMEQWVAAVHEWAPRADVHTMVTKNKTGLVDLKDAHLNSPFSVHIIGWETFRNRDFAKYKNIDGAIADESHRASNVHSSTVKALWHLNTTYRICMSATPGNNKLYGLYPQLHWIWWGSLSKAFPHKNKYIYRAFENYGPDPADPLREDRWLPRHFELSSSTYGGPFSYDIGPEKRFHSVIDEVPLYIQHLEDETCCRWHPGGVNASLPAREDTRFVYVDMTPTQAKLYKRADDPKQTMVWLDHESGQIMPTVAEGALEYLRKVQIALAVPSLKPTLRTIDGIPQMVDMVYMEEDANSATIDALISLLQDIVEPGDPVLVTTHSNVFARIVVERLRKARDLDFPIALWNGQTSYPDRDAIKAWFGREGGPMVIVASVQAIAEGTDGLQIPCRRSVALSWSDNMTLNVQLGMMGGGRLRRTGQTRRQQHWEIIVRETVQEERREIMLSERAALDASLRANPLAVTA